MKNFVQPGLSVPLPMPYDRTSGQGVLVGALFGVVAVEALTGVTAEVAVNGVFDITKEAPVVIAVGARVFWDNTNKRVTTTATANVAIGHAVVAAASADTTVRVNTATAAAPFGTTANQYRGLPLVVSGDQAFTTSIIGYTAGRVIAFGEARTAALTAASLLQIPANVLYAPTSDEGVYKTATLYFYADGINWRFGGCVGTWSLKLTTDGIGYLTFELRGQMLAMTGAALPTGWNTAIRPTPPRFVNGACKINYAPARRS